MVSLSQETVKGNRRQAGSVETSIEKEVSMEQAAEQLPQRKVLLQSHCPCLPPASPATSTGMALPDGQGGANACCFLVL